MDSYTSLYTRTFTYYTQFLTLLTQFCLHTYFYSIHTHTLFVHSFFSSGLPATHTSATQHLQHLRGRLHLVDFTHTTWFPPSLSLQQKTSWGQKNSVPEFGPTPTCSLTGLSVALSDSGTASRNLCSYSPVACLAATSLVPCFFPVT